MGKVVAGFFSFTEITDPAEHRSYNAWHQLDHLPEQIPLAGIVHGQRWVCTPDCRAARAAATRRLAPIHYVTLYLMADPLETTLTEFAELGRRLRTEDRFHQHRRSLLSGPFDLELTASAPRVLVSPEAVPYRPNLGVYVIVEQVANETAPAPDVERADRLLACRGVAGVWTFRARPTSGDAPWQPGDHRITVCYLDDRPLDAAVPIAAALDGATSSDPGRLVYAGPFETITPWQWDWFDTGP